MEDAAIPRKLFKIDVGQKPLWPKMPSHSVVDEVFPEVVAALFSIFMNDLHPKGWNDHGQVAKRNQSTLVLTRCIYQPVQLKQQTQHNMTHRTDVDSRSLLQNAHSACT